MSLEGLSSGPSHTNVQHLAPFGKSVWEAKENWPGGCPAPLPMAQVLCRVGQDGGAWAPPWGTGMSVTEAPDTNFVPFNSKDGAENRREK